MSSTPYTVASSRRKHPKLTPPAAASAPASVKEQWGQSSTFHLSRICTTKLPLSTIQPPPNPSPHIGIQGCVVKPACLLRSEHNMGEAPIRQKSRTDPIAPPPLPQRPPRTERDCVPRTAGSVAATPSKTRACGGNEPDGCPRSGSGILPLFPSPTAPRVSRHGCHTDVLPQGTQRRNAITRIQVRT
jgi:hypothetical protein